MEPTRRCTQAMQKRHDRHRELQQKVEFMDAQMHAKDQLLEAQRRMCMDLEEELMKTKAETRKYQKLLQLLAAHGIPIPDQEAGELAPASPPRPPKSLAGSWAFSMSENHPPLAERVHYDPYKAAKDAKAAQDVAASPTARPGGRWRVLPLHAPAPAGECYEQVSEVQPQDELSLRLAEFWMCSDRKHE